MKNKNKKKILRFIAVFSIISILFVTFAFPISALDIGGGATLTGLYSELWRGGDGAEPGGIYYENNTVTENNNQISFQFNLSTMSGEGAIMTNYSYYSFNSSNVYGTLNFSIKVLGGYALFGVIDDVAIIDTVTNRRIAVAKKENNDYYSFSYTGTIPSKFHVYSVWSINVDDFPLTSVVSYNLSFTPRNEVADKLDEDKYPSFGDSQDKIDDSQQIEDDSLNNASGFIDSTADFVFDRSLWTEGKFINGLRIASTTFENFASIPFIGTILKYAVIFGLIGFVLGLATFVMRRRK